MDRHLRHTLLGRFRRVNLKIQLLSILPLLDLRASFI